MTHPPPSDRLAVAGQILESPNLSSTKSAVTQLESDFIVNEALPGLITHEPTALLLDINNLYLRTQDNNFRIDYIKLRKIFADRCDLRLAGAFSAIDREDRKSRGWVNFMQDVGYMTSIKDLKRYTNAQGKQITKGNMDIELTLAAMKLSPAYSHVIIGTCDGDFVPLIYALKEGYFRKVSILGVRNADWTGMSDSLVRAADNFYDMSKILDYISMPEGDD